MHLSQYDMSHNFIKWNKQIETLPKDIRFRIKNQFRFIALGFETLGTWGPSTKFFISKIGQKIIKTTNEKRDESYFYIDQILNSENPVNLKNFQIFVYKSAREVFVTWVYRLQTAQKIENIKNSINETQSTIFFFNKSRVYDQA